MKRLLFIPLLLIAAQVLAGSMLPYPNFRAIDGNGNPRRGALLYSYEAGTSDAKDTYSDKACTTANDNPLVLNSEGEALVFLCGEYKLNLKTSSGGQVPAWPVDNVFGMNANPNIGVSLDEVYDCDIADAVVANVGIDVTLVADCEFTVASGTTVTIPETMTLQYVRGGIGIGVSGGGTETLAFADGAGFICGPSQQCFGDDLTVGGTPAIGDAYLSWFGLVGDDSTDDTAAFNALITWISDTGGGNIVGSSGKTYRITDDLLIKNGVSIDLQRATIHLDYDGDIRGIRMRNNTKLHNGNLDLEGINLEASGADFHTPVVIGEFATSNIGYSNIEVYDLEITSDSSNGNGILVTAGSNNIQIHDLNFPDSSDLAKPVVVHWGSDGDSPPALTTHPHNIDIRNITVGEVLGGTGNTGIIYISAGYNIRVNGVRVDRCVTGVFITAGDYGFYYASAEVKKGAHKAINIKNFTSFKTNKYGLWVDGFADNAPGTPIVSVPVLIENFTSAGDGTATVNSGIRVIKAKDVIIKNPDISLHKYGIELEEGTERSRVIGGRSYANRAHGIYIGHSTVAKDCEIRNMEIYGNGTDEGSGDAAGIYVIGSHRTKLINNIIGRSSESQKWGIRTNGSEDCYIEDNHVIDTTETGAAYSLGSTTSYGEVALFRDNSVDSDTTGDYRSGIDRLPVAYMVSTTTGAINQILTTTSSSAPGSGTWKRGDRQINVLPVAGANIGMVCTTGGTPGTWKSFGVIAD